MSTLSRTLVLPVGPPLYLGARVVAGSTRQAVLQMAVYVMPHLTTCVLGMVLGIWLCIGYWVGVGTSVCT